MHLVLLAVIIEFRQRAVLTWWQVWLKHSVDVRWLNITNSLVLLFEFNGNVCAHIGGIIQKVNLQALVAKDAFLVAEDGVRIGWVEGIDALVGAGVWHNLLDVDGVVGVGCPFIIF